MFNAFYALYNHFLKNYFLFLLHILHIYLTVRQLKEKKKMFSNVLGKGVYVN